MYFNDPGFGFVYHEAQVLGLGLEGQVIGLGLGLVLSVIDHNTG